MAIPPRRWVGYALLIAGLLLLFDTYTFLRTNWSPLHVPMFAPSELALGYLLALLGIVLLFAPTLVRIGPILVRMVGSYAPNASMKMGQGLAHQSVELRLQRRLPLKGKFSVLPNRGLVGGVGMLLLLIPMFLIVEPQEARGIYIRLAPQRGREPDENCLAGPIVVTLKQDGTSSQMLLDGAEISREELGRVLRAKLATRANWEVFVEGDDSVQFADPMYAIDVIHGLHAKAVILTPGLKQQMADTCPLP